MSRSADVVVVGAGPAGLAAATAAATHGKRVLVLDDSPAAGGQIWRAGISPDGHRHDTAKAGVVAAFQASGAELLAGRRVFAASPTGTVRALVEGDVPRAETIEWQQLILATGARERFLPFPGWTLPGVFGAGGLQALVKGGFSVAGKRVVVAGSGPLLLAVAAHLKEDGAQVVCIAEQAKLSRLLPLAASMWSHPAKLRQGVQFRTSLLGTAYRTGCWVAAAQGETTLRAVRLTNGRRSWEQPCDLLACGFHLVPNTELAVLLGCSLNHDCVEVNSDQRTSVPNIFCVGEPTGVAGVDAALVQGRIAGLVAAGKEQEAQALHRRRDTERTFGRRLDTAFQLRRELKLLPAPDTIVCRCEDVPFHRLQGQYSWTDAKLQTRCGMGACQGRVCGPAVQTLFGWKATSVRPPLFPVPLSVLQSDSATLASETETLQENLCSGSA